MPRHSALCTAKLALSVGANRQRPERELRDFLFRVFLARSARDRKRLAPDDDLHLKLLVVIRTERAGEAVLRQRLVVGLQVLLQRRLVILSDVAARAHLGDERPELACDERAGLLDAAVEIDRGNERL